MKEHQVSYCLKKRSGKKEGGLRGYDRTMSLSIQIFATNNEGNLRKPEALL